MSIKISSNVSSQPKKNLFSKLQSLTFSSILQSTAQSGFVKSTFVPARDQTGGHLDLESLEILSLLKGNIEKLADASSRVEFMMGELSQVMKKGI